MAKKDKKNEPVKPPEPSALERELAALDATKRAALLMLVLGEQQASDIIGYLNRDEVETLGTAMVSVNDVSQSAVDKVLDEFIGELRGQTNFEARPRGFAPASPWAFAPLRPPSPGFDRLKVGFGFPPSDSLQREFRSGMI